MDKFKSLMQEECSVGGLHCPCCNRFKNTKKRAKDKNKLNRLVRHRLKGLDKKDFHDDLID